VVVGAITRGGGDVGWSILSTIANAVAAFFLVWWPWPLVGAAAAATLFGAWWLWWRLPKRQVDRLRFTVRDAKARADVEDNFRKTLGQLLGGAAVLIGAGLAYMQFQQQQQASYRQFQEQQQAAHDLLISNQVSKGFEQLGGKRVEVRLGGIYALEGVMNASEQYYRPVLEALCAFVRDYTKSESGEGPPATEIQAALTVVGRRTVIEIGTPNLSYAHIPQSELSNGNLRRAFLLGANLSRSTLSDADLSRADLSDADLTGTFLVGADLTGAQLSGANLSGANLNGANLTAAYFKGIPSSPMDPRPLDLRRASLTRAFLINANLTGAWLGDADLSGANLYGANLSGADLLGSNITKAQLDRACGTGVQLDPGLTIKPCK
jgi:uncharacterized protein YjbI with pentapeptide repeats